MPLNSSGKAEGNTSADTTLTSGKINGSTHAHFDPQSGDRRVTIAIWANGLLTLAQVVGGFFAGSLALVADAVHNFSDMGALVIAFVARKIARKPADACMTFGYGRIEVVAALMNYTSLILVGLFLIYEGVIRLFDPPAVQGWPVVIIAFVALAVDALTAALTYAMQKTSINIRALFVHNLSDALASMAVIMGGVVIVLYGVSWVDPFVTTLIATYILYLAGSEINGPIRTLMLGSPQDIDGTNVVDYLLAIDGVEDVHHVHLWQMQEHEAALDLHVVVSPTVWLKVETIKDTIKRALHEEFGIAHSTLEFEQTDDAHHDARLFGHEIKDQKG